MMDVPREAFWILAIAAGVLLARGVELLLPALWRGAKHARRQSQRWRNRKVVDELVERAIQEQETFERTHPAPFREGQRVAAVVDRLQRAAAGRGWSVDEAHAERLVLTTMRRKA